MLRRGQRRGVDVTAGREGSRRREAESALGVHFQAEHALRRRRLDHLAAPRQGQWNDRVAVGLGVNVRQFLADDLDGTVRPQAELAARSAASARW